MEKSTTQIDLGRTLFFDKRLSANSNISCNDCHDLKKYGTNGEYFTKLRAQKKFFRDVPSIYNKSDIDLYNWDARNTSLTEKTADSLKSPHEMNVQNDADLIERLKAVAEYIKLFKNAYPKDTTPINLANIVKALVSFQNGLNTPAPIDSFLKGDDKALSQAQLKGALLFEKRSCSACHTGSNFGGQMIQKLGVHQAWPNQQDHGHSKVSKNSLHKMYFRVSPLRNIFKTAPYFHDASSKRLWKSIKRMSWFELGQDISIDEAFYIQDFLKSLTGELSLEYIQKPEMPK